MLQIKLEDPIAELKRVGEKKVFVQVPEGLKVSAEEIATQLQSHGFEPVTSMDACFGACDLKTGEAKKLGCGVILHVGHSAFVDKTDLPVVYAKAEQDLGEGFTHLMKKLVLELKEKNIKEAGLTTTIQFLQYLPKMKQLLEKEGIIAEIGKGRRANDGQVLGCNYSSAQVKAKTIIYLGDGLFHPLGIHFAAKKDVVLANPYDEKISTLSKEKEKFLRQRISLIEQAKAVHEYAVIVSTKEGQNRVTQARKVKEELEKIGKSAKVYSMDLVSQNSLLGINAEAYINTACPRISIDDFMNYKKPIINFTELDYLLGKKGYDEYELTPVY